MDVQFLQYLTSSNKNIERQESLKLHLKKKFFWGVIIIMFAVVLFPYIMIFSFRELITDATIITLSITSVAETMSAIIILPKIIAKYLFNKKEEENKIKLIEDMQMYNREKRHKDNNNSN